MGAVTVGLLQMAGCGEDRGANLEKGEAFCREAKARGSDIVLFPEMWSIAYTFYSRKIPGDFERWARLAVERDSAWVCHFRYLARKLEMAIAVTYLEEWNGAPRNTVSLIDRRGEMALTYAKVHTCEFLHERALTQGDSFPVATLSTENGDVRVGCMICFDRELPESARMLMLGGAEIILTPNACTLDEHRLTQFRTRSYENMAGTAMANYAAPQENGHSVAYDGVAYRTKDKSYRDTLCIQAGEMEGVYLARFDLEMMREYRAWSTHGNAYRRPGRYGALVEDGVEAPFVRPEARR